VNKSKKKDDLSLLDGDLKRLIGNYDIFYYEKKLRFLQKKEKPFLKLHSIIEPEIKILSENTSPCPDRASILSFD